MFHRFWITQLSKLVPGLGSCFKIKKALPTLLTRVCPTFRSSSCILKSIGCLKSWVLTATLWYRWNRMVLCPHCISVSFFHSWNPQESPRDTNIQSPWKEPSPAPLWLLFRSPPTLSLSENQDISRDIKDSCCGLNKLLRPAFWKDSGSVIVMLWKLCQSNNTLENATTTTQGCTFPAQFIS